MSTTTPDHSTRARRSRMSRWRVALVPVAIVTPLALTACGGSDDSSAAASSDSNSSQSSNGESAQGQGGPNSAAFQAYTACLQENGVTISLPEGGEGGPGGGGQMGQPPSGGETPQGQNGEMPQPPTDGQMPEGGQGGGPGGGFMGLDTSDATVQAAMTACSSLQPEMGQGGPGGQQGQGGPGGQQGQQQGDAATTTTTVAGT